MSFEKLGVGGGGWWVHLDYNVSSGPFLSFELVIGPGPGPGPELDKCYQRLYSIPSMGVEIVRLNG